MTNEQLLIYLYAIYPDGGWTLIWFILLVVSSVTIFLVEISHRETYYSTNPNSNNHPSKSKWLNKGFKRFAIPVFAGTMLFLSSLVPSRDAFIAIIAAPYVVDSGKSVVQSLNDNTSKLYKINKLMDNALDKALSELEKSKEPQKDK